MSTLSARRSADFRFSASAEYRRRKRTNGTTA
jgi:hypothetical protein